MLPTATRPASPNAPFPITLTVLKSSKPSLVLRNLRYVDSFLPCAANWRCLRSSVIVVSAASLRSSSTRLAETIQLRSNTSCVLVLTLCSVRLPRRLRPCKSAPVLTEQLWREEQHRLKIRWSFDQSRHSLQAFRMRWQPELWKSWPVKNS
jgi:hypothetical protein